LQGGGGELAAGIRLTLEDDFSRCLLFRSDIDARRARGGSGTHDNSRQNKGTNAVEVFHWPESIYVRSHVPEQNEAKPSPAIQAFLVAL